jgi:hypothetical protein
MNDQTYLKKPTITIIKIWMEYKLKYEESTNWFCVVLCRGFSVLCCS